MLIGVVWVRDDFENLSRINRADVHFPGIDGVREKTIEDLAVVLKALVKVSERGLSDDFLVPLEEILQDFISCLIVGFDFDATPEHIVSRNIDAALNPRMFDVLQPRDENELLDSPAREFEPGKIDFAPPFDVLKGKLDIAGRARGKQWRRFAKLYAALLNSFARIRDEMVSFG